MGVCGMWAWAARAPGRWGTSVVEAVVALVVGLFLICLTLTLVARQRAAVASLAETSDALAAVRVARQVLGQDARDGDPVRDGWALSSDSLALRAFRGTAWVCGPGPTPLDLVVATEGVRLPQPAKDSVLLLGTSGGWTALALEDAAPAPACAADTAVEAEVWRLSARPPPGVLLARYFERGSYHVAGEAIRYRRGMSGRQPLTPGVVRTPESAFEEEGGRITLFLEVEGSSVPWRISVPTPEPPPGA